MNYLSNEELCAIKGGAINGTFLNAMTRMFSTLLEVGRAIGSSIIRHFKKNYCI